MPASVGFKINNEKIIEMYWKIPCNPVSGNNKGILSIIVNLYKQKSSERLAIVLTKRHAENNEYPAGIVAIAKYDPMYHSKKYFRLVFDKFYRDYKKIDYYLDMNENIDTFTDIFSLYCIPKYGDYSASEQFTMASFATIKTSYSIAYKYVSTLIETYITSFDFTDAGDAQANAIAQHQALQWGQFIWNNKLSDFNKTSISGLLGLYSDSYEHLINAEFIDTNFATDDSFYEFRKVFKYKENLYKVTLDGVKFDGDYGLSITMTDTEPTIEYQPASHGVGYIKISNIKVKISVVDNTQFYITFKQMKKLLFDFTIYASTDVTSTRNTKINIPTSAMVGITMKLSQIDKFVMFMGIYGITKLLFNRFR
uniref:Uncharacterized protein n=1 Tax=Megaviridae environmental sample TaxID=1737588 RepID=A0A5J6VHP0_9VIRU|nr:MAG: hypothetical protein [Megaviridae environmental sample]